VELARAAVEAAPDSHPERARVLSNLGSVLADRYERTASGRDLAEAVQSLRQAVQAPHAHGHERPGYLFNLGDALRAEFERGRDPGTAAEALRVFREVAETVGAPARIRLGGARSWGGLAADLGDWGGAVAGYSAAIELLPALAEATLPREDRVAALTKAPGLANDAAAAALQAGQADQALTLLEQGRAVLLTQALAERDGSAAGATPGLDELCTAALDGPVVVVNPSRYRCDALVVQPTGITIVPLRRLSLEAVYERTAQLHAAIEIAGSTTRSLAQAEGVLTDTLAWLWDSVADPVLAALGIEGGPGAGRWPRLWWCPAGALAFLPLHAAGRAGSRAAAAPNLVDRVVCSYTPTVRALPAARRKDSAPTARVLAVGLHHTPGLPDLPDVEAELRELVHRVPSAVTLTGRRASRAAILQGLADQACLHFAGHARQNSFNITSGVLHAQDGPITISELARLRLPGAQLAFLSACQTAGGNIWMADESLHLAGALQLAGFAHVIATQWVMVDSHAPEVAASVYAALTAGTRAAVDASRTAVALHGAVRQLRGRRDLSALVWAPYVHIGP
jgi:hypothetical protein